MAAPIDEGFTGPAMTVDFCEVNSSGEVTVGGKVGPDSKLRQPVFVSRGAQQLLAAAAVNENGTFEGTTAGSGLRAGVHTTAAPHLTVARRLGKPATMTGYRR
jgi:hypothetical protein